jgi:hypothetical protein
VASFFAVDSLTEVTLCFTWRFVHAVFEIGFNDGKRPQDRPSAGWSFPRCELCGEKL